MDRNNNNNDIYNTYKRATFQYGYNIIPINVCAFEFHTHTHMHTVVA